MAQQQGARLRRDEDVDAAVERLFVFWVGAVHLASGGKVAGTNGQAAGERERFHS